MYVLEVGPFSYLSYELRKTTLELGIEKENELQSKAIPAILKGEDVLVISPTGSGKTEAALLPIFEKVRTLHGTDGTKALYITPLRALNRDMLRRIESWGKKLGLNVEVRHGDTSQKDRRRQSVHPPDILVTTPETLQVLLIGSRLRNNLRNLKFVVIDEIHSLASERRGAQLSFGLERLQSFVEVPFQRIGLSATVGNPSEISKFLVGSNRKCRVIDASYIQKARVYEVEFPFPETEDKKRSRDLFVSPQTVARLQRIIDLVNGHERTLIFVNSRTLAETLGSRLALLGLKVGVHHGSLPREERERVEGDFKHGLIRAMICTSTLELGIDIGAVDLVIQYMSPRRVSSLIQRVGRSGHSISKASKGITLNVSPEDVLETVAIIKESIDKRLEPTVVHECPLDVLSHQVAGMLIERGEIGIDDILRLARTAYSFRSLTESSLLSVLAFMEKLGYLTLAHRSVIRRGKCRNYYLENLSMIRDERRYSVIDATTQQRVGILGEEFMIIHARIGVHFVIKGRAWRIESIQEENVYVTPVEDPMAAIPGWDGELLPIPQQVAERVGEERRKLEESPSDDLLSTFGVASGLETERAAREAIFKEIQEQTACSVLPTDKRVVVERFKNYLIVHTSRGDRINDTLGELFEERLLRLGILRNWWSDGYRILIELNTEEFDVEEVARTIFQLDGATRGYLNAVITKHFPFGYEMKFIAERFGALKRGRMLSGDAMKELAVKYRFTPIYEETLREARVSKIDIDGAIELLKKCSDGRIQLALKTMEGPSPISRYILSRYLESEDYEESPSDSVSSMRASIEKEWASLFCFDCGYLKEIVTIGSLHDTPVCENCRSRLLSVLFYGAQSAKGAWTKKKKGQPLSSEESSALTKARRTADVVLAYGKKGAIALSVYGIGPQSALRVLSKMHDSDEEFYQDLLKTKLKFIETKRYWD